jgi:large subunit ribosomal protein L35
LYFPTFATHLSFLEKNSITHKAPKVSASAERQQGVTENRYSMPKVKTNSSAKKRFKVTGTGKITHQKSFKRHILTKKSKKRKRALRKDGLVHKSNLDFVKRLLRLK